jgi:ABC-type Fe3+/spermidine/putrescine transport system ATPase subunit
MTAIRIASVERRFGAVHAVRGVSIDVADGEFFTLLGPSGCGKTTLLRMVAGFCELDGGSLHFGERRIDTLPPHRRNTGMVFQNYAIFPNLSVAGNVAYGLKARKIPSGDIGKRVARALALVHLGGYEDRWPHQLSGGQLQRVAIARCLVIEPEVLLLDEPLSNLDAQLRVEMRGEIRQLQKSLGITALYVTHDQEEALAISDRIAVMRAGGLEQVGAPDEIYRHPATPFVAEFMGTTNLLAGTISGTQDGWTLVRVGDAEFRVAGTLSSPGEPVTFSLRPEALRPLAPDGVPPAGWARLEAQLARIEFLGALTRLEMRLAGGTALHVAALEVPPGWAREQASVALAYDPARITVFRAPSSGAPT